VSKPLVITGGTGGIGSATARAAAMAGYEIVIGYYPESDAGSAQQLVKELGEYSKAIAVCVDVGEEEHVKHLFSTVEAEMGAVYGLVNCAGIDSVTMAAEAAVDTIRRVLEINVLGTMLCCREALARMQISRGGGGGVIVNVSSMAASSGGRPGMSHYAASKGAIDVFTLGVAREAKWRRGTNK